MKFIIRVLLFISVSFIFAGCSMSKRHAKQTLQIIGKDNNCPFERMIWQEAISSTYKTKRKRAKLFNRSSRQAFRTAKAFGKLSGENISTLKRKKIYRVFYLETYDSVSVSTEYFEKYTTLNQMICFLYGQLKKEENLANKTLMKEIQDVLLQLVVLYSKMENETFDSTLAPALNDVKVSN